MNTRMAALDECRPLRAKDYQAPQKAIPKLDAVAERLLTSGRSLGGSTESLERWIAEYLKADRQLRTALADELLVVHIRSLAQRCRRAAPRRARDVAKAVKQTPTPSPEPFIEDDNYMPWDEQDGLYR